MWNSRVPFYFLKNRLYQLYHMYRYYRKIANNKSRAKMQHLTLTSEMYIIGNECWNKCLIFFFFLPPGLDIWTQENSFTCIYIFLTLLLFTGLSEYNAWNNRIAVLGSFFFQTCTSFLFFHLFLPNSFLWVINLSKQTTYSWKKVEIDELK